jgi:hypothetical protein
MGTCIITTVASGFMLLCALATANAQSPTTQPPSQLQSPTTPDGSAGATGPGMMRHGGMMHGGMMDMMGRGMMGQRGTPAPVMRIIFALMDSDGDGTVSLQEFQAAHERIFKAMDANKDGVVTLEEMQAFISGQPRSAPPR